MADSTEASSSSSSTDSETSDDIHNTSEDETSLPVGCTRKRPRMEMTWQKNKRKRLRNEGKSYITSKGSAVPPRVTGNDCKCSMGCFKKLSSSDRTKILKEFNHLGTFDLQTAYLHGLIHRYEPKRRYTSGRESDCKRKNSFSYYIRYGGKEIRICLRTFCSIHGISIKRVRNIRSNNRITPPLDQRGKHNNRPNQIPETTIGYVKRHILSFPRQTSHYSRNSNPNRRYLTPDLNIAKLHRLYQQKCDELNWPTVIESMYRNVFCENFNFNFGSPKSDTCKTCETLNCHIKDSIDDESKAKFVKELQDHHDVAEFGFQSLRNDTELAQSEPDLYAVFSFDLQQNLPTPHIQTNLVFYLRQLWVYNLGIHNVGNGNGYMCMWSENIASRGSDEIASCLLSYILSLRVKPKHDYL